MLCPPFHFKEEYVEREKKEKKVSSSVVIKLNQKKTENERERTNEQRRMHVCTYVYRMRFEIVYSYEIFSMIFLIMIVWIN